MFNSKLEVQSEEPDATTRLYRLNGALFGTVESYAFQDEVRGRIAGGAKRIVIDLAGVERIDSSGIGILVALMYSASRVGGRMILAALPQRVATALGTAMLLDRIERAGSAAEALARFGD